MKREILGGHGYRVAREGRGGKMIDSHLPFST
jgi:hypothetical protein